MAELLPFATDPALVVALALAAGILSQSLARHLRIPGIVLLLAAGVLMGPDIGGLIEPASLGETLHTLVGFAVAVILFEGGMNLNLRRLRREARSIRQLVTLGAIVTAVGGSLAGRYILGWDWTTSMLFGVLVIVTGPTVITPLLRRIRVNRKVATVLEAEGVLVDAVGAIVAAVALQVAISPSGSALAFAAQDLALRLGFGAVLGLAGGIVIALLLRFEKVVPDGLENVFTLSLVLALFQASNAFMTESGIMTVTMAGLAVGNVRTRVLSDLREFKEQLTVMLIGMLFVLLAADVRIEEVHALGWPGVWTVVFLMFVVRPLNILVGTWGSDLTIGEKSFLSWIAPRGIVAAAVASLFAHSLDEAGIQTGHELRAMVFLVIAATVLLQGLSGGIVARLLGLRRPVNAGYAILGANDLGRALGRVLRDAGQEVVFLESNPDACHAAQAEDFRVLYGIGLDDSILQRAELEGRLGAIAVTPNDGINMVFARKAHDEHKVSQVWVALRRGHQSVTRDMVHEAGGRVLFGEPRSLELWTLRLERGLAVPQRWRLEVPPPPAVGGAPERPTGLELLLLILAVRRGRRLIVHDDTTAFKKGDEIDVLIFEEKMDRAVEWLRSKGWVPVERVAVPEPAGEPSPAAGPA